MQFPSIDDVSKFAGLTYECECGHTHTVPIRHIEIYKGAIKSLSPILQKEFAGKKAFIVADRNTYPLAKDEVLAACADAKMQTQEFIFPDEQPLVLDELLVGRLLMHFDETSDVILTIGSGQLNDLARVVAAKTGIPYFIIATAPSMDGYASSVSPVVMDGGKMSVELKTVPYGIIADPEIAKTAPLVMFASGLGDVLGKYCALVDWRLAEKMDNVPYCPQIAALVEQAADACRAQAPSLKTRSADVAEALLKALVLSGLCICMYGNSRPASGSEHQISHCFEVDAINAGDSTKLHGNYVGLGLMIACRAYEMIKGHIDYEYDIMSKAEVEKILLDAGGFSTPEALGVTRQMMRSGFSHATYNKRYTLFMYLERNGLLEEYGDKITAEFYDK